MCDVIAGICTQPIEDLVFDLTGIDLLRISKEELQARERKVSACVSPVRWPVDDAPAAEPTVLKKVYEHDIAKLEEKVALMQQEHECAHLHTCSNVHG